MLGLGLFVLGVLTTSNRGWVDPVVWTMIAAGIGFIGAFVWWIKRQSAQGKPTLVSPAIFRHASISAGLPVLATQTFAQAGLLFLVPLFAQAFLGLDAFETGLVILPLSISVLLTSILTPGLGRVIYPKYIIQAGLVVLFIGGALLAFSLDGATSGWDLALGLAIVGVGIGLVVGQLPNLILSGVDAEEASEASGLQGTAQNLGMALGTALVGTVILSVGITSVGSQVDDSEILPTELKTEISAVLEDDVRTAGTESIEATLESASPEVQAEAQRIFDDGIINGFQAALLAGASVALLGALLSFKLPKAKLEAKKTLEQTVRAPSIANVQL